MRRLIVGMAMMAMVSMPVSAWAGDREIAEQIIAKLKTHRDSGALKDFKVDLKVNNGTVALTGSVASLDQRKLVLDATKGVEGIRNVLDQMQLPEGTAAVAKPAENKSVEFVAPRLVKAKPPVEPVAQKPIASQTPKPTIINPMPKLIAEKSDGIVKPAGEVVVPESVRQSADKPQTQLATAIEPIAPAPVASATKPQPQATVTRAMPMPIVVPDNMPTKAPAIANMPPAAKTPTPVSVPTPDAIDNDRDLNMAITRALTDAKNDGRLRGFAMDITTNAGDVFLQGRTVTQQQKDLVLDIVRDVPGVLDISDNIEVLTASAPKPQPELIRQASDAVPFASQPEPALVRAIPRPPVMQAAPQPVMQSAPQPAMTRAPARMMPVPYRPSTMPRPYAPASTGMMAQPATMMGGQPMPMQPASAGMAYGSPRHDQPNMPNYAWPGYSAYPNYAALSYPKQYSPSAWPYIGPFYPYPQVPLNWRKVTLEWDDGWWQLDYSSKSR